MENKHKLKHRFDIIRKLGQGTYGKVQLAINKETGQEVAIKTIKKSKIENEQDAVRIRREIQIMSSIRHPNIVHIYEVFENKDKIVLVMQNASGGELYEYLSERKVLTDAEARRIFRQVVAAVYYIHKNKICHRDLKLENILLDEKGNAKIADFGLSNVYDEKYLLSTFCGSPLYASPEIVKGLPYYGPEVDCWSLGVLLYTLAYGAMPFDGSNFKKLVKQISNGDYYEPKQRALASGLIRHLLTVNVSERASIIDVCKNDWVNETYETQLLQVAEDLANLSPVRLDLLIALQPQISAQAAPACEPQLDPSADTSQMVPANFDQQSPTAVQEETPDRPEQVVPSASLTQMPAVSVRSSASLIFLKSSPSTSSMKSTSDCKVNESASTKDLNGAESTLSPHYLQAAGHGTTENQDSLVTRTPSALTVHTEDKLPPKSISSATIELKPKSLETLTISEASNETASHKDHPENLAVDSHPLKNTAPSIANLQEIQIVSKRAETVKNKEYTDLGDSCRGLVWPSGGALRKPTERVSPEGSPDNLKNHKEGYSKDVNESSIPRGLPMKSYKKFTFERNGGQVVVRERICQKEQQDGNKKIVFEKKVTSRTSTFDTPLADGLESTKTRRGDDSSDEDDFDLHFDSSRGPMGLLNVMKFMDRDFRMRWQNHPVFQNLTRRPLGITSELLQGSNSQRLHSPSLMKSFMDRETSATRDEDNRSFLERRHPSLLNRKNDLLSFNSVSDVRSVPERKLSRGSSLDRSSLRSPRTQPTAQVDPVTGSVHEHCDGRASSTSRNIPRYARTVSDKTLGESQLQSSSLKTKARSHQGRPPFVVTDLNFNSRHPASFGLTHSWSNHGLWQQQNQKPHQGASGGSPSKIEMRVHYTTSTSPPSTPSIGMPLKPPKADRERRTEVTSPSEESVSNRINRRSYYYRFSSVDRQLNTRPVSTIWDQQTGAISVGAGALWEAASPDKPLGAPRPPLKTSLTQESNTTSM